MRVDMEETSNGNPGGRYVTVLENVFLFMPHGEAVRGSLAWRGDSIIALGDPADVRSMASCGAKRFVLDGALVLPGLWDSHTHMLSGALEMSQLQLRSVNDRGQLAEAIERWLKANPMEPWILGGGWDDSKWGGEPPAKEWVDAVSGSKPLFLVRYDMHSALVNSAALRLAGINANTPDPPGGKIARDPESGEPTGWLLEKAMELVSSKIPPPDRARKVESLSRALRLAARLGLTGLHDLVWQLEDLEVYEEAFLKGLQSPRVFLRTPLEQLDGFLEAQARRLPPGLFLHGVKGFLDGSLGSRSAWLRDPYEGSHEDRGVSWVSDPDELEALVFRAAKLDVPVSLHAIGDAAIAMALDLYWKCVRTATGRRYLRIEHFQHPSSLDIQAMDNPRFVASMQPVHMLFDAEVCEKYLGEERARRSFPIRSLMELSCKVVFGSDWPVADLNPLEGIQAAVGRQDAEGRWPGGWNPWERISLAQALGAYTATAAWVAGVGGESGKLQPGWRADLTVLDRDITGLASEEISRSRVVMTVVGGQVVHEDL